MEEQQQKEAEREAQIHVSLLCPQIARFNEAFYFANEADQQMFCIVMELGGESLESWLANNADVFLRPRRLLELFRDVLRALAYLHARELVHRDLSTKNLILFDDLKREDDNGDKPYLKLIDFGVSTQIAEGRLAKTQVGTPHTMAPEIFDGATGYGAKADIWAAGCVFYELFTRTQLFKGLNCLAIVKQLEQFVEPQFPTKRLAQVYSVKFSAFVTEFICLCMKRNPDKRPDARTLAKIVENKLNTLSAEESAFAQPAGLLDKIGEL